MNFETRAAALDKIYDVYDKFTETVDVACRKGCSPCCTRNVTLTTLEGHRIVEHMKSHKLSSFSKTCAPEQNWNAFSHK